MLFSRPDHDTLYDALIRRDPAHDGLHFVCVTSTRVFCRLTCSARKPKSENCIFEETIAACLNAGFRPCKRCRPLLHLGGSDPMVSALVEALESDPGRRWSEQDVIACGHDPSTVRRAFKRRFGMSFLEMARLRRLGNGADTLSGGESVIEAQLDAGYGSGSGFRAAITKLFGTAPATLRGQELLKADFLETPIGTMLAIGDEHALHLLEFIDRPALASEIKHLQARQRQGVMLGKTRITDQTKDEIGRYFEGRDHGFSIRLAGHGSAFERDVWRSLQAIPIGETRSYSALAAELGRDSAVRAVARANGTNQIAIIIPCHRVIGADGSLTGYGGGLWRKRWLIEHERRMALSIAATAAHADQPGALPATADTRSFTILDAAHSKHSVD
jgi:AraC family transcriptional regulator, regulatory protein of adaptative response / methylated-DNA-[protein]-cysteine methyltransferase